MIFKKIKFINTLTFSLIFIFLSPSFSFSKIKINDLSNKIHVLDVYGKRYTLDNSKIIKTGDYLQTRKNPAILIFNNKTKVCFSTNSSLKIENIKFVKSKFEINLSLKKGHILLSIPKNSKDKHNVIFSNYRINNFKDEIIISKQNKLEFLNFNNNLKLIFKDKKNYNIPPYSYSKLSEKENIVEINNATDVSQYTSKFLEGCVNQIQNLKEKRKDWKLQYGCITQNGRLVCGNRYK